MASRNSLPSSVTRAETPAFNRGSGFSNWSETSNNRVALTTRRNSRERPGRRAGRPSPGTSRPVRRRLQRPQLDRQQGWGDRFLDLGAHFHPSRFNNVDDRPSRPYLIAGAILRQDHSREDHAARRVAILLDRYDAIERRANDEAFDDLLGALHRELGLVLLLERHRERCLVGRLPRFHVFLQLSESPPRFFKRQLVFLGIHRPDELVRRRVQLAASHVKSRGQQRHFVLRGLDGGVGLDLDDVLLGLVEFRLGLFEGVLLIRRIELDDRRARLDAHSSLHECDQAQHATNRGRNERDGAARAQIAIGMNGEFQRTLVAWVVGTASRAPAAWARRPPLHRSPQRVFVKLTVQCQWRFARAGR